jgi:hypothetical protein
VRNQSLFEEIYKRMCEFFPQLYVAPGEAVAGNVLPQQQQQQQQ